MRLFGFELAWATATFSAVLPERTALPHGIAKMEPERFLAETISGAPFVQSVGLRAALWMVALAPLWLLRRPATILGLGAAERQVVLERLLASPVYAVRQLALTFKALASMIYAQSAEARAAMTTSLVRGKVISLRVPRRTEPLPVYPSEQPHEQSAE